MKACSLLGKGCEGFLCNIVKIEGAGSSLEDIPTVRELPDMFPNELPGRPPLKELEFCVDQVPRATPISRAPYRMALAELKE